MKRRFFSWVAAVAVAAAVFGIATGCAWFGGEEEEDISGSGDRGEFSEGGLDRGGSLSGSESGGLAVAELQTVYFDFDRAVIRDDQKPSMRSNTEAVRAHEEWRIVVVEGNTDERGTEEYNLALGERRANSVKQYLVNSGVSASRVDTVSFGESKPAVQGHDEAAWKWNRRADFRVIR